MSEFGLAGIFGFDDGDVVLFRQHLNRGFVVRFQDFQRCRAADAFQDGGNVRGAFLARLWLAGSVAVIVLVGFVDGVGIVFPDDAPPYAIRLGR